MCCKILKHALRPGSHVCKCGKVCSSTVVQAAQDLSQLMLCLDNLTQSSDEAGDPSATPVPQHMSAQCVSLPWKCEDLLPRPGIVIDRDEKS
jgi:hypothetical protein